MQYARTIIEQFLTRMFATIMYSFAFHEYAMVKVIRSNPAKSNYKHFWAKSDQTNTSIIFPLHVRVTENVQVKICNVVIEILQ